METVIRFIISYKVYNKLNAQIQVLQKMPRNAIKDLLTIVVLLLLDRKLL